MGADLQNKNDFLQLLAQQNTQKESTRLMASNDKTQEFGLTLTEEQVFELLECKNQTLRKFQRVEFGESILPKLIDTFCDSAYINQDDYLSALERLQDIFYEFKQESEDLLTDEELLTFMHEQFEMVCFGDTDYLEGTCLDRFSEAIRCGYREYQYTGGRGEYEQFSTEMRWDKELYMEVLRELCWR